MELPKIETSRLILRRIELDDAADMYEYAKLSSVGPQAGWQPHMSINETKAIIKLFNGKEKYGQPGVFAVVLKREHKMIGTIELHTYTKDYKAELGYTINPSYWGNGYAVEASKAVLAWGFEELNLKRIECNTFANNFRSIRVCEKLGLTFEGIKRKGYMLYDGNFHDIAAYAIIDEDFFYKTFTKDW